MQPISEWYDCKAGKVGDWYIGKGRFGGRMVAYSYLKHCRRIPFWLRRAYDRQELRAVVYYPMPLNYVARWLRAIWRSTDRVLYWVGLLQGGKRDEVDKEGAGIFDDGVRASRVNEGDSEESGV